MAQIKCVCISTQRKTSAQNIHQCQAALDGLAGDIHQGWGERQVSMLPMDCVQDYFSAKGTPIEYGHFGENLVIDGLDWETLSEGQLLSAGTVKLQIVRLAREVPSQMPTMEKKYALPWRASLYSVRSCREEPFRKEWKL